MKNLKKTIILALIATLCSVAPAAPKANAVLLVSAATLYGGLDNFSPRYFGSDLWADGAILCVLLLPVCLLDEKSGSQTMTSADLAANGYSSEQIKEIDQDQAKLQAALKAQKLSIKLEAHDTAITVKEKLEPLVPEISDTYVSFLVDTQLSN
jgi:hypothetical protein